MKTSQLFLSSIIAGVSFLIQGAEIKTVIPGEFKNLESPASGIPFTAGERYQIIFTAQNFQNLIPNGGFITQIGFRVDGALSDFITTLSDFEIRMSTTPRGIEFRQEESFSANLGLSTELVLPRSTFSFNLSYSSTGVHPFDLKFRFETPYYYSPNEGNLLLDMFSYGGRTGNFRLDRSGSLTSRAYVGAISVDSSATGDSPLVTELTFLPVPEPTATVFISVAFAFIFLIKSMKHESF